MGGIKSISKEVFLHDRTKKIGVETTDSGSCPDQRSSWAGPAHGPWAGPPIGLGWAGIFKKRMGFGWAWA